MGDYSFPASHRLLKSAEFDAVFKNRDYSVTKHCILLLASRNDLYFNRLGMVVGKKSLSRAVDRNFIKRHIRDVFRHLDPMGLDIVTLVKPGIKADFGIKKILSYVINDLKEKRSRD